MVKSQWTVQATLAVALAAHPAVQHQLATMRDHPPRAASAVRSSPSAPPLSRSAMQPPGNARLHRMAAVLRQPILSAGFQKGTAGFALQAVKLHSYSAAPAPAVINGTTMRRRVP